jgi:hypothetical protein
LLRSVTRGGGGVQKGEKLRYVIYGQPLMPPPKEFAPKIKDVESNHTKRGE